MMDRTIVETIKEDFDWNLWRRYYTKLTFTERKEIYNYWASMVSTRSYFDVNFFIRGLEMLGDLKKKRIVELGSNIGQLAVACLEKIEIGSWVGYEISRYRVENTLEEAKALGFKNVELKRQLWEVKPDFDVFISSHTLEHLDAEDCFALLDYVCIEAEAIILEVLFGNWTNYSGAHILNIGSKTINSYIIARGYKQIFFSDLDIMEAVYVKDTSVSDNSG